MVGFPKTVKEKEHKPETTTADNKMRTYKWKTNSYNPIFHQYAFVKDDSMSVALISDVYLRAFGFVSFCFDKDAVRR